MDTTILVEQLYDEGKKLIESLDKEGFKYPIALWINFPFKNDWELLIGVPHLKTDGSKETLRKIHNAIKREHIGLSLSDIKLEDTQSELCRDIRATNIRTGQNIAKMPFIGHFINGKQFPDSLIYRIR
jgi:hypothetical protein